jgi:NAD(P)-dependent dehydrogenase (short-subunit alcohol dehydrogenase family)
MKNVYGSHVFVTGASSGLGRACALAFAQAGCQVVGVSRSCAETVTDFPGGGRLTMRRMDVRDDASVQAVAGALEQVDIALLAAGLGVSGPAEELPMELAYTQMETNYFGVLRVGRVLLSKMRQQGHGLFLVIGSIAGRVPIPMQSHYSASKYALEAYVEAVRMEMRPFGVRACILEPGDTKTGFTDARQKFCAPDSPYGAVCEKSVSAMEHDEQNGKPPESVAAVALKLAGRKTPPVRVPIGLSYKALMVLVRFLPARTIERILRLLYL